MGTTWVLSAPDGPHVSPMSLAIRVDTSEIWVIVRAISSVPTGAGSVRANGGLATVKWGTNGSNTEVNWTAQGSGLTNPGFCLSLNNSLSLEWTGFEISFGKKSSTALSVWLLMIRCSVVSSHVRCLTEFAPGVFVYRRSCFPHVQR